MERVRCGSQTLAGLARSLFLAAGIFLTSLAGSACSEGGDAGVDTSAGPVRADSAGIEVVTSAAPAWGTTSPWSLSTEPVVTIGTLDGDPAYVLDGVGMLARLSDGRIVVVNGGTRQIRVYSTDGTHLYDFGQQGDGPGEFRIVSRMWALGDDSILVHDARSSRLTYFDDAGTVGRTLSLATEGNLLQVFARRPFDDGTLVVEGRTAGEPSRPGLFAGSDRHFAHHAADGTRINALAEAGTGQRWGWELDGSVAYTMSPFAMGNVPAVVDGTQLHFGPGEESEITSVAPSGQVTRILRWAAERRAVTAEVRDAFMNSRLEGVDPQYRAMTEAMLEGLVFPDRMPAYRSMLADSEGYLWVQQFHPLWEEGQRWWVFDPSGAWLGEPSLPSDFELRDVGEDYVLGVRRDDLGVESVVMYALERGG